MADINQRQGRFLQVPREFVAIFPVAAQRLILNWAEAITAKVNNSAASLSDVEQRSGIPALSRVHELDKYIANLVKSATRPLKGRIMELEKEIAALKKHSRPRVNLHTVERQISDIEKTYRPR